MFSSWLVEMCRQSDGFLDNIWFSDEAHFYLDGHVSPQNCRFWAAEPPDLVKEKPLHSPKVTVWCAISSSGIIGPLWFEDLGGKAVTINAEQYQEVLEEFWT